MDNPPPTSSRDELLRLRREGKVTEQEYQQLLEAITRPPSNEPPPAESTECPLKPDINAFRMRLLTFSLVVCLIGLPVGIAMRLPYVWGLAIAGIIVAPIKMRLIARSQDKRP